MPPALAMSWALPAVPWSVNWVFVPFLVVTVALPAVVESAKEMSAPPPLLTIVAAPPDAVSEKVIDPLLVMVVLVPAVDAFPKDMKPPFVKVCTFDELLTIPAPVKVKEPVKV